MASVAVDKPNPACPITRDRIRRLKARAVIVTDASGPTRFDGDAGSITEQAQAYGAKGAAVWSYETAAGNQLPWPKMGSETQVLRDPQEAIADRTMYMVERMTELVAKAHRDAYSIVGTLMQGTIEAQGNALAALANRSITQEQIIEQLQASNLELAKGQNQSGADKIMSQVLDMAGANSTQGKPNGTA